MNPYEVLGVPRNATEDEIKRRARKLAREFHPDREGGDVEKMALVNRAKDVLLDPEKRERYDRTGEAGGVQQTLEERAFTAILKAFSQALDRGSDAEDWFKVIRRGINTARAQQKSTISEARSVIRRTEKARKRVKGGTMFDGLFEQRVLSCRNAIAKAEEELEVCSLSEEMLKGYAMEVEEGASRSGLGVLGMWQTT